MVHALVSQNQEVVAVLRIPANHFMWHRIAVAVPRMRVRVSLNLMPYPMCQVRRGEGANRKLA